jgi:RNA polymerase sigma factor (sigma-70 family)
LKGWLLTICRNHIYNRFRDKKEILLEADEMESIPDEKDADTFLEELIKKEQVQLIYKYLEKRPFIEREFVYEQLRFKEIAQILACSPDAAKKRFYRILAKMRKEIAR